MSATAPSPASPTVPEGLSDRAYVRYPDLDGRHVFITGGGSGIGAYFVHAFASQGARVSFVSLHADAGDIHAQQRRRLIEQLDEFFLLRNSIVIAWTGPIDILHGSHPNAT